jgi:hypothetical protein
VRVPRRDVFALLPPLIPEGPVSILGLVRLARCAHPERSKAHSHAATSNQPSLTAHCSPRRTLPAVQAAGTVAWLLHARYPALHMHGWELDGAVVQLARQHMGLAQLEQRGCLVRAQAGTAGWLAGWLAGSELTGVCVCVCVCVCLRTEVAALRRRICRAAAPLAESARASACACARRKCMLATRCSRQRLCRGAQQASSWTCLLRGSWYRSLRRCAHAQPD